MIQRQQHGKAESYKDPDHSGIGAAGSKRLEGRPLKELAMAL